MHAQRWIHFFSEKAEEVKSVRISLLLLRQNVNAVVVWTDEDVEPNSTYRLRAARPDGAASMVSVTLRKLQ